MQPGVPGQPGGYPPNKQPYPFGQAGAPGGTTPGAVPGTAPGTAPGGAAGSSYVGGGSYLGGSTQPAPAQPQPPGYPGAQPGTTPYGGNVGSSPQGRAFPQQGTQGNQNEAVRMIQQILTSPRPQGAQTASGTGMGGQTIGGGVAGVASTVEQESIIVYDEHQNYNEWEFIYDMSKDRTNAGVQGGSNMGTPANPANRTGQQQGGGFGNNPQSPQQPIFGPQTGPRD